MSTRTARPASPDRWRHAAAEAIGTAFLLAAVIGSGIMAADLTDDVGLQLLQNAFATAGVLGALILAIGPISGAHFNPAVTLAALVLGAIDRTTAAIYTTAQVIGGALGVIAANLMFDLPAIDWSTTDRAAGHLWWSEAVATYGLVLIIFLAVRRGEPRTVAVAVAGYVGGGYYFTASTGFANPAVSLTRTLSDTFAGIEPASAPAFVIVQLAAALAAAATVRVLTPDTEPTLGRAEASDAIVA